MIRAAGLGAFLAGKPVDEALLRPILQQLRDDLAEYGAECADECPPWRS